MRRSGFLLLLLLSPGGSTLFAELQETPPPPTLKDPSARIEQALRAQDLQAAMREYRAMVAADPGNSQAWTGMGVLLYGSGQMAQAADAFNHALAIDPATPRAELFLALSRADLSDCQRAIPVLNHHFESEPAGKIQRLTGLTLLGCLHGGREETMALRVAAQMKQSYPGDPDVLYASAELYTRMWNETADELITTHPDSYRVHQLAAEVNEAQGHLEQAIRQYRTALAGNPKLTQMHYRIGQLILQSGAPDADDRAMEEFRAELSINPQSASSALAIAEIDRHGGKLTEAGAEYTHALELEPGLQQACVGLAQTLLAQHHVEAAQEQLSKLIAEHPENAQAHYALMLALREQGKLTEASQQMAIFQRLQQSGADQFQKKLNALLTGTPGEVPPAAAKGPTQ